jgi:hypothetical protein
MTRKTGALIDDAPRFLDQSAHLLQHLGRLLGEALAGDRGQQPALIPLEEADTEGGLDT